MIKKKSNTFMSCDTRTSIHVSLWCPDEAVYEKPRAILQLCHGMIEYIDRYDGFGSFMAERGILVVGNDHLGHGKSVCQDSDYGYFMENHPEKDLAKDAHHLTGIMKKMYPGEALQDVHMNEYVYAGDRLKVLIRETEQSEKILPVELPFPVVYEDEDLVVVNKPPGMPIHPSIRHYDNTLGNAAAWYFKDRDDKFVYRCINRLDKDTTGLTIIAKNPLAGHLLQEQMRQDRITRIYTAIVEGVPEPLEGIIDLPIARKDASIIERQVDQERGEPAVTHFKVLENLGDCALVQLRLETGRTHQIRVHMKAVGHPLLGDYMYNPAYKDREDTRQALHAGELIFFQPVSGEKIHLRVELPGDMQEIIEGYAGACKGL